MRKALVTGASKGLGRAVTLALATTGWEVIATSRSPRPLEEVAHRGGAGVTPLPGDVRNPDHRHALAEAIHGDLDLLINNASHLGPSPLRPIGHVDEGELHAVFDTNVVSPLALIGEVLPALRNAGGTVVNVSSDAAVETYATWGPYGASKAALDHASAILALEEPPLRIYAFDPGDMRTDMHQAAFPGEDISDRPPPEEVVPALLHLIESDLPSGRYVAARFLESVT